MDKGRSDYRWVDVLPKVCGALIVKIFGFI